MPVLCRNRFTLNSNSLSLINLRRNSASYITLLLFSLVWLKSKFPTPNFFFLIKSISFTLPYFDLFQFEPDFRTPNFSFSPPFMGCGSTMNISWIWFLDPNFFCVYHCDDAYYCWGRFICLPTILNFFSDKHNFQSTLFELWNTMHIF